MEVDQNDKELHKINNLNKQSKELQNIFIDPISLDLIEDAVISSGCGHSFSQDTIESWLTKKQTCPLCHSPLSLSDLTPNYTLRDAIKLYGEMIDNKNLEEQQQQEQQQEHSNQQQLDRSQKITSQLEDIQKQIAYLLQDQQQHVLKNSPVMQQKDLIRELWQKETNEAAILLESTTRNDEFIDYFFGQVSWKQSGTIWYNSKMIEYALKRARVTGMFNKTTNQLTGLMICQPPFEVGVSITQMLKVGMYGAPLKMGIQPLARVLKAFDITDKIHQELTQDLPHWYINCICVQSTDRRLKKGSDLLLSVLQLADSQMVHCYTEISNQSSLQFFQKHGFKIVKTVQDILPFTFYCLLRDPKQIL
ncbi:hypothetical protein DLAC_06282 [Tieghemostelium lacteum]|uniref:U-box domain-containing protein n=1 Tax=Tieghemostelium lacteum TaxID=361077 RepID=A0A151ZEH4_TIELA|nr:hypothetical protein DLAC_06282 [Tieghemostelium lacteum]|eukprot:KYQ92319.1 hypothetical protein DLAC_06282 [Tieghemostelium lacteum]